MTNENLDSRGRSAARLGDAVRSEVAGRPAGRLAEDIACAEISNILTFAELPDTRLYHF